MSKKTTMSHKAMDQSYDKITTAMIAWLNGQGYKITKRKGNVFSAISNTRPTNDTMLYWEESHKLVMRLTEILTYSNLQDLRTINETLIEMGFGTKEDFK